jgi:hypothetical protein
LAKEFQRTGGIGRRKTLGNQELNPRDVHRFPYFIGELKDYVGERRYIVDHSRRWSSCKRYAEGRQRRW